MITTFKQLKDRYSNLDNVKEDESKLMIGNFFFRENGEISLTRVGFGISGEYMSIHTEIAKNRTLEQMHTFIQSIL